jgi:integrase
MGRRRSTVVHEKGPVRVTGRAGSYRIRGYEHGTERERSARSMPDAVAICDGEAERLTLANGGTTSGSAAYGALWEAWMGAKERGWSEGHRQNVASLLRVHVGPTLGKVACDRLTEEMLTGLVFDLADQGYSADWCNYLARQVRSVGRFGVRRGLWTQATDPAQEVKVPSGPGRVDRTLVPSADQVGQLLEAVAAAAPTKDQRIRRTWMVAAAAGSCLRWIEVLALTADDVDLAERTVSITKKVDERTRQIGQPKTAAGTRVVTIPTEYLHYWNAVVEHAPDGSLAMTQRGKLWRNSGWHTRVYRPSVASLDSWPVGAGFHYLRHHGVVAWFEAGLQGGDLAAEVGHTNPSFTMDRYFGETDDRLDKARRLR